MFLTQGITAKFADYHDPRTHNIPTGVHFVLSIGILVMDFSRKMIPEVKLS